MLGVARLWRRWKKSGPRRVRWLYIAMALSFSGLALVATLAGDATVAVLAGLAGLVTIVLAVAAPRFARGTEPPPDAD